MSAKESSSAFDNALPQMEAVMAMGQRNLQLMSDAGVQLSENMRKAAEAMSAFMGDRLRKDMEMGRRLAECRSPEEVWNLQRAFMDEAMADYARETSALIELVGATALSAGEAAGEAAAETAAEAPVPAPEASAPPAAPKVAPKAKEAAKEAAPSPEA
ncbi:phasin family protein [Phenylobacterium sp.]|uniref:phasin family protein n=1 Tax=Phenylobacterium sp. TaxID=1871053 RepID=UPI002FD8F59A